MPFRMPLTNSLGGLATTARVFGAALGILAATFGARSALADVKSYDFGKTGNWKITAVYKEDQQFSHCAARVLYKSGMEVYLIAYSNGVWSIQFYDKTWPERPASSFPATLQVDGRVVMQTNGKYRGRSAFIDLGAEVERVRAIMRGQVMSVISESGTSSFRLDGTSNAARVVADCWTKHRQAPVANNNNGAFGAAPPSNNGAFGRQPPRAGAFGGTPPAAAPADKHVKLDRPATLEMATQYLSRATMRYEILAETGNVFRHFPVNWRYQNGAMGAMMIFDTTRLDAVGGLESLLTDLATACKGRSSMDRKPLAKSASGQTIARATAACESDGTTYSYDYSVAQLANDRIMMILESVQTSSPRPTPGASGSNSLPPSLAPPSSNEPNRPAVTPRRPLDPNEL